MGGGQVGEGSAGEGAQAGGKDEEHVSGVTMEEASEIGKIG